MAVALEDSVLICQPYSLTSHLGLTLHPTPLRPGPDLPQPLPLLASVPESNQPSELPSRQTPMPDPGVRVPQRKRAAGKQSEPVTPPTDTPVCYRLTSLIPLMRPQATRMAGGNAFPVPARPQSGAPPGPCFRPHVSGFSFLPVSTAPPPLLPTHMPLSTDILSSFLPPFLPLCLGAGVLSPHGPPSLLPLLNTVPLEIRD